MALEDEIIIFEGPAVKPLSYFEQLTRMPNKADKFDLRLRMVKHAIKYGVKPTARVFDTTPKTVRKWLNRYEKMKKLGKRSGVGKLHPHMLRHTYLTRLYNVEHDLRFVQDQAGHASPTTTAIYAKTNNRKHANGKGRKSW